MKNQQGFIPLVAIILLSLVAIGGGIIATQSLQEPKLTAHVIVPPTPESTPSLAPVSPRIESSTKVATK